MRPRCLRRSEIAALLFAGLTLAPPAPAQGSGQGSADGSQTRVDYVLRATVQPETMQLEGDGTVTWHNASADAVSDLWFHLHLNAYSNNLTTHLWESEGKLRGEKIESGWSYQQVTSMTVDGKEILGTLAYQRPDDGRQDDRTVFSVQLPSPVPPGGTVSVDFRWTSKLPRVRRRTGLKGNFILLSHWFPKLGVYEEGKGWNCHQFHMNTEFYSDYGTYDVTLDLPAEYEDKIGASGVQVESKRVDGDGSSGPRVVTRFLAPSMEDREYKDPVAIGFDEPRPVIHGFAWTADPDYVVVDDKFEFSEWRAQYSDEVDMVEDALGMDRNSLSLRDVKIKLMIQPEREGQAERHIDATMTALFFYGLWFGEYPYEQVTVVDPAWGGSAAAGMEYPTLFTCGTSLFTEPAMHRPEGVTVHEAGHQFWYGLVGNNEYENAWMDEGFNSFTDSEAMYRRYGLRRGATWYSGLPVWRVPIAAEPASTGLSAVLTGQRLKIHLPAKMKMKDISLAPLEASPFIDWWRDQPWLTFGEDLQDPRWSDRSGYLSSADVDPVRTDGWRYMDRNSYRTNSYPRPAVVLRSLTAVIGYPAFLRGMRHYAAEWRYRHPYPQDFYAAFIEGSGQDVGWYFDELLEGTATVNWSVEVSQRRHPEPRGLFLRDGKYELVPAQPASEAGENSEAEDAAADDPDAGDAADDDPDAGDAADESETADGEPENAVGEPEIANPEDLEEADEKGEDKSPWLYDVVVRRRGTLRLPVEIEVSFKDGSSLSFEWTREMQAESNWWRLPIPDGKPNQEIERVLIDPERRYFLDTDMSDNQWYKKRDTLVPMRWSERAYTQYVHLLHWFSSMGG